MKKIISTILCIVGISAIIAQNTILEQSMNEIQHKINNSQEGEKLKWLDSLSKITLFEPNLHYDSIVRETINLAKILDSSNLELFHTTNLIIYQNNTLKKPEIAIQTFEKLISKTENFPNADFLAKLYLNGSYSYYDNKNYYKSIETINKALSIFEKLNDIVQMSNCYFKLGLYYTKITDYEKSLFYYFKSLKIDEQINNEKGIGTNLEKIGEFYLLTGDLKKAQINFEKALEIFNKINDEKGVVFNLTNLGASYQKSGNYIEAIRIYKNGLSKAVKIGLKRSQSILLGNIGSSLKSQEKYDESLEYLFNALNLKIELKRLGSAAHSCNDICETYMEMNNFSKAKEYALQAIKLSEKSDLNQQRWAYFLLSQCNFELSEFKDSYTNLILFNTLQDSIYAIKKVNSMNEMQIKYETEKQDYRIKEQEKDIALLNSKNKINEQWLLFGSTGLISLFGFILLIRSRNKAKQKQQLQTHFLQDLIQSQENERNRIAKELHDSIGQQLTLLKKKLQNTSQEDLTILTNNTLEEVRSISRGLYPALLKQLGLSESIEQLIFEYDEETDLFFSTDIDDINSFLNETKSLNFYRFIQECVTNAIKHSEAKSVSLSIKKQQGFIVTILSDNGKGFNINGKIIANSLGLKTISERIKILNGTLFIDSKPGKGTTIKAKIPL